MSAVQFARPGEEKRLMEIYRACFPEDDPAFWQWVFHRLYRPEDTLVLREKGDIAASLQMLPCKLALGERRFDAHYIYAASTIPSQQGKGLMGRLLEQAAEEGRRRGQAFSVLITQEDSLLEYYARFGYAGRFCIAVMPPRPVALSAGHRCRPAALADIPALDRLYEEAAKGMLHGRRDRTHWELQLALFGEGAWVLERSGSITAYAFADERGVMEAAGPEADVLAAQAAPDRPWRTLPGTQARPMGSIKPLREEFRETMEQNPCFLNLMYN